MWLGPPAAAVILQSNEHITCLSQRSDPEEFRSRHNHGAIAGDESYAQHHLSAFNMACMQGCRNMHIAHYGPT